MKGGGSIVEGLHLAGGERAGGLGGDLAKLPEGHAAVWREDTQAAADLDPRGADGIDELPGAAAAGDDGAGGLQNDGADGLGRGRLL